MANYESHSSLQLHIISHRIVHTKLNSLTMREVPEREKVIGLLLCRLMVGHLRTKLIKMLSTGFVLVDRTIRFFYELFSIAIGGRIFRINHLPRQSHQRWLTT